MTRVVFGAFHQMFHTPRRSIAKSLLKELENGGQFTSNSWQKARFASESIYAALDLEPVFIEGFKRGAHKDPAFWRAVKQASLHFSVARMLLPKLAELGGHTYRDFWEILYDYLYRNPIYGKRLLSMLFERDAYLSEEFADVVFNMVVHYNWSKLWPRTPFDAIFNLFLAARSETPFDKNFLKETLEPYMGHPAIASLHSLGRASGWYLKSLLQNPQDFSHYLSVAILFMKKKGKPLGKKAAKHLYKNLGLLHAATMLGVDYAELCDQSQSVGEFAGKLRRILSQKVVTSDFVKGFNVDSSWLLALVRDNPLAAVSTIEYLHKHRHHAYELLQHDANSLHDLKWSHTSLSDSIRALVEKVNSMDIPVYPSGFDHLIRAILEEAENERVFEKRPKIDEKKGYITALQEVVRRVQAEGANVAISPEIIDTLRNIQLANDLGVSETVNKVLSFFDRKKMGTFKLRVADDPVMHLHFMNIPGSCMRASGTRSYGALSVTGGPALVFAAVDDYNRVRGRIVYFLYRNQDGNEMFVPNYSYGYVDLAPVTRDLLKQHGLPVHNEVTPPSDYEPAPSKFFVKTYWKDGVRKLHQFRQYKERK